MQLSADAALDRLIARLLADPAACARLATLFRDEDLAAALGVSIATLRERQGRFTTQAGAPQAGWLPVAVRADDDAVDWAFFGGRRLDEPFFGESVGAVRHSPLNRLLAPRTPLAALEGLAGPAPEGLIFHMSRCGSTLVGQMLGVGARVLSEAAPIDAVVRADLPRDRKLVLLRGVVGALGRAPGAGDERLFLKLDCWHARAFDLFREAFPHTPWIHLYRSPDEVLVSHARGVGEQMVPSVVAPSVFGLAAPAVTDVDYRARVLAVINGAMLEAFGRDPAGLLVSYDALPGAVTERILPHFRWSPSAGEIAAMAAAAGLDAKASGQAFRPDGAAKRAAADPAIRAACARWLDGLHGRLEEGSGGGNLALRQAQGEVSC